MFSFKCYFKGAVSCFGLNITSKVTVRARFCQLPREIWMFTSVSIATRFHPISSWSIAEVGELLSFVDLYTDICDGLVNYMLEQNYSFGSSQQNNTC